MGLTWFETFSAPGGPPDPAKWTCCVDQQGGGNQELQYYIPEAVSCSPAGLVITASRDTGSYAAWNGPSQFLSGKVWSKGKFEWRYGHLDVVASLPVNAGSWPAVWMLGANLDEVGWPFCAELDVAEWFGGSPNPADPRAGNPLSVSGSAHSATDNPTAVYTLPAAANASTFHTYSLDWRPTSLEFSVDGHIYSTLLKKKLGSWPFDLPQFLILNLAIGGTMGGNPPATGGLPYQMVIKSVALYDAEVTT